ncbi:hypothetical protein [Mucilaginibacter sp. SP1R1]|uniref:hypothetical protein n=1 Tax=Mucilaginibacter sp. SP1R1 TaxID=2723091 RepID=UPI0016172F11|nr:hypothetical protein [Mucilaginibacter sp. SP1R1]MBB6151584.1 hypothetical protein [Mucilaginibacter sp. SP1R1]
MKSKIFKQSLLAMVILLTMSSAIIAQESPVAPPAPPEPPELAPLTEIQVSDSTSFQLKLNDVHVNLSNLHVKINRVKMQKLNQQMKLNMKKFDKQAKLFSKNMVLKMDSLKTFAYSFDTNIVPQIAFGFKDFDQNFSYNTNVTNSEQSDGIEKVKNYSKSYPVDGNDKLKLDNQYGRITVNTWDRHEVKVDIQIKASANQDNDAQSLLDGVQISDSKNGDVVSFKTNIERMANGRNRNRKIEVNYIVNMPAKMQLDVQNSYGSIVLPDLDGVVKISASYSNVVAQSLNNPANEIEGSYGSLKIGVLNGGKLDFSYGNVDLAESNNLKADVNYGSLKLGKIKGHADLNLSYMGGLKIGELDNSLKRLNINSSYSGMAITIPDNNNFDFDVTVSYAGFNFNNDKITITSKTPADGTKGWNPTKNYKGHFGKGNPDSKVVINSSYGSVKFD